MDIAGGLSHAQGAVYEHFASWYTVADLEALGLWESLAAKAELLGFCSA